MNFEKRIIRAAVGDDDAARHGTWAALNDAAAFFILVGAACGLTAIYATITGAW